MEGGGSFIFLAPQAESTVFRAAFEAGNSDFYGLLELQRPLADYP